MSRHDERHALQEEVALLSARREVLAASMELDDRPHDWGEESDATQLRDELDWIDRRILDVRHLLYDAARNGSPEQVTVGDLVTLRLRDGELERVKVTPVPDEDFPVVTPDSPLGRALLGARVGEEVSWEAPGGRLRARVEDIQPDPVT